MCAQPGQGHGRFNFELGGEHAGGLVHFGARVGAVSFVQELLSGSATAACRSALVRSRIGLLASSAATSASVNWRAVSVPR